METGIDGNIVHPATVLLSGMSGSGKTTFMQRLLLEKKISPMPTRIVWLFAQWQPIYNTLVEAGLPMEFVEGIPDSINRSDFFDASENNMLVIDDLMLHKGVNELVAALFIHGSRHRNLSIFYLIHNIFWKSKVSREIRLNAKYLVVFRGASDSEPLQRLGRQLFPRHVKYFEEATDYCMSRENGYIVIQLHPQIPNNLRLMTDIFCENQHNSPVVFKAVS